ncbi:transcriptional regulator [Micromonospora globispora]|uniref:excisionase family DNA-binding protein n=1 Tax=Micromonospora globispora TaxID=1450148 RepID=UPI000D6F2820|nr:excisionase family DNA-binding protein [Micromonospora globispora]PWU53380.1 transcriptional regulator [Micromonospora globispora]
MLDKLCYTAREAATLLSVSRTKVYELLASGQLRSIRIGRSRRIAADELRRFISAQEGGIAA